MAVNHEIKITGEVIDDYDFGLSIQTSTYEYYKLGEKFEEYKGYNIEITLKHWAHEDFKTKK